MYAIVSTGISGILLQAEVVSSQVGVAAQLPSGRYSTVDLGYEEFWSFLLQGEHAFEDLNKLNLQPNP